MKNKRNVIYALILPLVVVSGLVFANREIKNETEQSPKSLSIADRKTRWMSGKNGRLLLTV